MREFHQFIIVDGEQLLFYFTRTYTDNGAEFFVSVIRTYRVFSFDMQRDVSLQWKITTPVPEWIKSLEGQLSNVINHNIP